MLLSVHNISKSFGEDLLFQEVSFQVEAGDKLAIVGQNGCGKSTLLKILTGELEADTGEVVLEHDKTFGYLAQYQNDTTSATIYDYALSARGDLLEMEARLRRFEGMMTELSGEELNRLMEQYHTLNHTFELKGGFSFRSEVAGVLKGLGFSEEDSEKNLAQLSGGQKTRASLARLLMSKPGLLLLEVYNCMIETRYTIRSTAEAGDPDSRKKELNICETSAWRKTDSTDPFHLIFSAYAFGSLRVRKRFLRK